MRAGSGARTASRSRRLERARLLMRGATREPTFIPRMNVELSPPAAPYPRHRVGRELVFAHVWMRASPRVFLQAPRFGFLTCEFLFLAPVRECALVATK